MSKQREYSRLQQLEEEATEEEEQRQQQQQSHIAIAIAPGGAAVAVSSSPPHPLPAASPFSTSVASSSTFPAFTSPFASSSSTSATAADVYSNRQHPRSHIDEQELTTFSAPDASQPGLHSSSSFTSASTSDHVSDSSTASSTAGDDEHSQLVDHTDCYRLFITRLGSEGAVEVVLPSSATVLQLKQRVYARELADGCRVRLLYLGRTLTDECTLEQTGVRDECQIQSHITEPPSAAAAAAADEHDSSSLPAAPDSHSTVLIDPQVELWRLQQQYVDEHHQAMLANEGTTAQFFIGFALGFVLGEVFE